MPGRHVFLTRLARLDGQVEALKDSAYVQKLGEELLNVGAHTLVNGHLN